MKYTAVVCPCRSPHCNNWLVEPVAAIQGVSFTEPQARAVALFLEQLDAAMLEIQRTAVHVTPDPLLVLADDGGRA